MTGAERIHTALSHREPDRVPYDLGGTTVTAITRNAYTRAMRFRGLSDATGTDTVDPVQQIVTPCHENLVYLKVDTRRIGARRIMKYSGSPSLNEGFSHVTDFYGCTWRFEHGKNQYFNQVTFPLQDYDNLTDSLPHLHRVNWQEYIHALRRDLDDQILQVGDFCCIADRNTAGLTENSLRIRGYEKWYMDTMTDQAGVEALLDIIVEDKIRYWDAVTDWAIETANDNRIGIISECDDLGSQNATILEPEILRKLVIPRLKVIFSHIRRRLPHVKIFMHSCGAIREIIPDLIEAGVDILNPIQYTASGMELDSLKGDFGDVLTFWGGGVDTQSVLNRGTPGQVRDEVRRTIDILAPGGGFVFTPVHNIQDDVPPENFWAMWDTLQEYGRY